MCSQYLQASTGPLVVLRESMSRAQHAARARPSKDRSLALPLLAASRPVELN